MKLFLVVLVCSPFVLGFGHGLRTGRAWVQPKTRGGRRRFRWVDRYEEPFWFWGAMVAYVAAVGWICFFAFAV